MVIKDQATRRPQSQRSWRDPSVASEKERMQAGKREVEEKKVRGGAEAERIVWAFLLAQLESPPPFRKCRALSTRFSFSNDVQEGPPISANIQDMNSNQDCGLLPTAAGEKRSMIRIMGMLSSQWPLHVTTTTPRNMNKRER